MISNLPAYPAYRDSGLPWVGTIPAHWNILRNGRLFTHRVETGFPDLPILEVSLRTGVRVRDLVNLKRKQMMTQKEKYKRAVKGDIAYNMMRMWQGALGVAPTDGLVSPAYVVIRPFDEVNSAYYEYLFRTAAYMNEVNKFSRGIVSDRNRLYWNEFKQMPSIIPARDEQDKIVTFLRVQDRQIARFIRDKRRLIELLNEQKQSIIHRAVTRGLDPNVRLRPSGIDWLGDVPEHWEIKRLKTFSKVVLGKMLASTAHGEGAFKPYLRSANIQWLFPKMKSVKEMWVSSSEKDKYRIHRNDLLVSEGGEVGRACMWSDELEECYIQNSVHKISTFKEMEPRFLLMQFLAHGKRGRFESIVNRVSIAHLTREKLVDVFFVIPPLKEQKCILSDLEEEIEPINATIERAENEIDLIREYRERLISDVVTGKVDVRSWIPAPEDLEADDEELAVMGDGEEISPEEEDGDAND